MKICIELVVLLFSLGVYVSTYVGAWMERSKKGEKFSIFIDEDDRRRGRKLMMAAIIGYTMAAIHFAI
jgi:hypothetical protein